MAPGAMAQIQEGLSMIAKRQSAYYCSYYGCGNSGWYNWGRWVLLGCVVGAAILLALLFSCLNARRRRNRGVQPMYGTGWLAGKPHEANQGGYYNNGQYANPAPPYEQQPNYTGQTFNQNQGYYGQQQGIEMQPPQQAYYGNGGQNVYTAPEGPPPAKR